MKNKKVLAVLGLAVVVAAGGTLAYFNQTMVAENEFDTGKYGNVLVETFTPEDGDQWEPGVEVNKDVEVTNTGDQPLVVRVKFDEAWSRDGQDFKVIHAEDDNGIKIINVEQVSETDGLTPDEDDTVVEKKFANSDKWILGTDGYYYYVDTLTGGESTGKFLDSVTLAPNVDMGQMNKEYTYTITVNGVTSTEAKVPPTYIKDDKVDLEALSKALGLEKGMELKTYYKVNTDSEKPGYSDADYKLTIQAETVQATTAAVENMFRSTEPVDGLNWDLRAESLN